MSSIKSRVLVAMPSSVVTTSRSRCRHGQGRKLTGPVRTVVDDSGSLAIIAWTCAACGNLIEELHLLSRDGTARPYPIRHAVVPQVQTRRLAALSVAR